MTDTSAERSRTDRGNNGAADDGASALTPWAVLDMLWSGSRIARSREDRRRVGGISRGGGGADGHGASFGGLASDADGADIADPSAGEASDHGGSTAGVAAAELLSSCATSPYFRVPDTVFVHHSRITRWYFTAKDGTIKTKGRQKLTTANVIDHFTRVASKRVGAARCIQTISFARHHPADGGAATSSHSGSGKKVIGDDEEVEEDPSRIVLSVVSPEGLRDLITSSSFSGLIQTFIEPRSESLRQSSGSQYNAVAIATWTRNVLYVEKRANTNDMSKTTIAQQHQQLTLEDRTTLESSSRYVRSGAMPSTYTVARTEQACARIASEIELGSGGAMRVTGLVAYFKVDAADRLVLLACERVRVVDKAAQARPILLDLMDDDDSDELRDGEADHQFASRRSGSGTQKSTKKKSLPTAVQGPPLPPPCVVCKTAANPASAPGFSRLPRRHVLLPLAQYLETKQRRGSAAEGMALKDRTNTSPKAEEPAAAVPREVAHIDPAMDEASYRRCSRDPAWMDEGLSVCHDCVESLFRVLAPRGQKGVVQKGPPSSAKAVPTSSAPALPKRPASQLSTASTAASSKLPALPPRAPTRSTTPGVASSSTR